MANTLDVVGATEAKDILGVELQRISRWIKKGKLPPPYARPICSPVWFRVDIEWVRDHGSPGDYHKPPEQLALFGTSEVAARLGVDKSQVSRWRRRPNQTGPHFPDPAAEIAAGRLWLPASIERFAEERSDRPERIPA